MLNKINLENVLFLDIETVPEAQDFDDLTTEKQALWAKKSQYQRKEDFSPKGSRFKKISHYHIHR